jgi:hypothetical protein
MNTQDDVLTDEEYQQLLEGGTAQQSLARAMELQQKQAEAMRGATPQGQMVSGHYVAPNPMQYIGEMAKNYQSARLQDQAMKSGGKMDGVQGAQNAMILKALQRNSMMNRAPAQGMQPPPEAQINPYQQFQNPGAGAA